MRDIQLARMYLISLAQHCQYRFSAMTPLNPFSEGLDDKCCVCFSFLFIYFFLAMDCDKFVLKGLINNHWIPKV